jgi:hypothetical protein
VDARVKPARRTKRPGAGSRAFAFNFEAVFPSADQNMGPDVCKESIVVARVSSHAVDIRGGPIKFGPARILQADTEI